jgi:DNA-binding GntR family transcriptional regulator
MARGVDETASYLTPGNGDAWRRTAEAAGGRGTQKLRSASRVTPPDWVATAFGLPANENGTKDGNGTATVIARYRTMYFDDRPVELTDSFYPLEVAADTALEHPARIPGGAISLLAELGYIAHHADESVELDAHPTHGEAELLAVETTTRVVRIRRVVKTATGIPFETMEIVMLPASRTLHHRVIIEP